MSLNDAYAHALSAVAVLAEMTTDERKRDVERILRDLQRLGFRKSVNVVNDCSNCGNVVWCGEIKDLCMSANFKYWKQGAL